MATAIGSGFLGNCGYRAKGITSVETCRERAGERAGAAAAAATASSCLIWGHLRRKFAKSIVWKLYKMAFRTVNQGEVAMKGGA